jgi:uncharacterized protein YndB with AHSA1/START domain
MTIAMQTPAETDTNVHIERIFTAPRELVFAAWTDPQMLPRWFAPEGCRIDYRDIDIRENGRYHSCITTPGGDECWCVGEYLEINPPARLVFTMAIGDANGNRVGPEEAGFDPEWPRETIVTVTFDEHEGGTKLTLQQSVRESLAKRTGAYPSWLSMLDRMEQMLRAGGAR